MRKRDLVSLIVGLGLCPLLSYAQKVESTFAAGGPLGIYVALGVDLPAPDHPVKGATAYLIERKSSGDSEWKEIATTSSPASLGEFRARLQKAMSEVPEPMSIDNLPVDSLWQIIDQYRNAYTLKFWSGVLSVRLAAGMMYLDTTAEKHTRYEYRVSLIDRSKRKISTLVSNAESYPQSVHLAKLRLFETSASASHVMLEWMGHVGEKASTFKAYRQEDLRGEFRPIEPLRLIFERHDSMFCLIQDTLVQSLHGYRYFLLPTDYYGNTGVPSDTAVVGTYEFRLVPLPEFFRVLSLSETGGLRVSWRLRDTNLIRNLTLYRSVDYDTGYRKIADLPSTDTAYVDQTVEPMRKYFYYLVMRGPLGESSPPSVKAFGMFVNSLPPIPPAVLGAVGTKEGVRFSILATDARQRNFQVFRTDGYHRTFNLISGLIPRKDSTTEFADTSSTLSGGLVYAYAVRAEDASHVFSGFSDTVYARPKKLTHPTAPLGLTASVEGSSIQLYWQDMLQIDDALKGYLVYRKEIVGRREERFVRITDSLLSSRQNRFKDSTCAEGRIYEYAVRSFDIFGGESELSSIARAEIQHTRPVPPSGLRATAGKSGVHLEWDQTFVPKLKEFRVYRYERKRKPVLIHHVLSNGGLEFTDTGAKKGNLYFYFVTSVDNRGLESGRSKELSIRR